MYGEGISREGDLVDVATEKGLLEKSGAWYSFGGERIGQGRENAKQFLRDNADVRKKLEAGLDVRVDLRILGLEAQVVIRPRKLRRQKQPVAGRARNRGRSRNLKYRPFEGGETLGREDSSKGAQKITTGPAS